jgi:hypothetical protein
MIRSFVVTAILMAAVSQQPQTAAAFSGTGATATGVTATAITIASPAGGATEP